MNIFPECFRGPLKTLWRATFGSRDAICPSLVYLIKMYMQPFKLAVIIRLAKIYSKYKDISVVRIVKTIDI